MLEIAWWEWVLFGLACAGLVVGVPLAAGGGIIQAVHPDWAHRRAQHRLAGKALRRARRARRERNRVLRDTLTVGQDPIQLQRDHAAAVRQLASAREQLLIVRSERDEAREALASAERKRAAHYKSRVKAWGIVHELERSRI